MLGLSIVGRWYLWAKREKKKPRAATDQEQDERAGREEEF
jgi:hypothetical protein